MKRKAPSTPSAQRASKKAKIPKTPLTPSAERSEPWKQVYLVGTEWNIYNKAYEEEWDFSHFHQDLSVGSLAEMGEENPVYLFGVTEPQSFQGDPTNPQDIRVVLVPCIVAVVSNLPPPSTVALNSLQREEEILSMKELKMDWVPYVPSNRYGMTPGKFTPYAYFLQCFQRRSALNNMSDADVIRYQYALPYVFIPRLHGKLEYTTDVSVLFEVDGKACPPVDFDWSFEQPADAAKEYCKAHGLEGKESVVQEAIEKTVKQRKSELKAQSEALKAKVNEMPAEEKEARDSLKCFKYYPKNVDDHLKSKYINRYYGKAVEIR